MSNTLRPVAAPLQLTSVSQTLVEQFTTDFSSRFQTKRDPANSMREQTLYKLDSQSITLQNGDDGAITVFAKAVVTSTQFRGAPIPLGTTDVAACYDPSGKLISIDEVEPA